MLVESLIKETVELQGFRMVTVQQTDEGLEARLAQMGVMHRVVEGVDGVPADSDMCRCGGSMYIWCMLRAG